MPKHIREVIPQIVDARGYSPVDVGLLKHSPDELEFYECLACADVALCSVDSKTAESQYLAGAAQAAFVPSITFSGAQDYEFSAHIPVEYQPRIVRSDDAGSVGQMMEKELDVFEQDFLELGDQSEVETYATLLVDVASQKGNYDSDVRNIFIQELIMRDQYNTGQAVAVGPGANVHHMNFTQVWNENLGGTDPARLAAELSALREALLKEAKEADQYAVIGTVASAETEAKNGNGPRALEYLSKAGSWALETASKIGVTVAAAALKEALGIK